MIFLFIVLILINLVGFIMMGYDKSAAVKKRRRIPEKRLMFIGVLGGATGILLAMKVFRHKTKVPLFFTGIPLVFMLQVVLVVWLLEHLL